MKINLKQGQEVFLTSDTHYNHTNLCRGKSNWDISKPGQVRDFNTLKEMNNTIVNNINDMVGENDILIHFGDWSFGGIDQIWEFRKQIKCKNIYLIFGNHDEKIRDNKQIINLYKDVGTYEIIEGDYHKNRYSEYKHGECWSNKVYTQDLFTWCGHYQEFEIIYPQLNKATKAPRYKFVASHYPLASWNEMGRGRVHFHGHCHLPTHLKVHQGKSMDIGMDGNVYKPYLIHEAYILVKDNPIQTTTLKQDHHV